MILISRISRFKGNRTKDPIIRRIAIDEPARDYSPCSQIFVFLCHDRRTKEVNVLYQPKSTLVGQLSQAGENDA